MVHSVLDQTDDGALSIRVLDHVLSLLRDLLHFPREFYLVLGVQIGVGIEVQIDIIQTGRDFLNNLHVLVIRTVIQREIRKPDLRLFRHCFQHSQLLLDKQVDLDFLFVHDNLQIHHIVYQFVPLAEAPDNYLQQSLLHREVGIKNEGRYQRREN